MSEQNWTIERIRSLIDNRVQENLQLDYKAGRALDNSSEKRNELQKDVSAMANSAGGVVIYGVSEKNNFPQAIDPVDQSVISKEWIENILHSIQPRIPGILIHPIRSDPSNPNLVVYVIEIPQGQTAHQSQFDRKYYKRFNFKSEPMYDYEIRDVMQRSTSPRVSLEFEMEIEHRTILREIPGTKMMPIPGGSGLSMPTYQSSTREHSDFVAVLHVFARNEGSVFAQFVVGAVDVPESFLDPKRYSQEKNKNSVISLRVDNLEQHSANRIASSIFYRPILPSTREKIHVIHLRNDVALYKAASLRQYEIIWSVSADNALPRSGRMPLSDIALHKFNRRYKANMLNELYPEI